MPPNLTVQLLSLAGLIRCSRQTSVIETPPTSCLRIAMICFLVKLDLIIVRLLGRDGPYLTLGEETGLMSPDLAAREG